MIQNTYRLALIFGALSIALTSPAQAYIGPGVGAGTLAVVAGILGSITMAFLALLWYPIKRLLRTFRKNTQDNAS